MIVKVTPKEIMATCEATYQAGVRDGVRYSADVLEALKKEIAQKHNASSVLVDFCDTVKRVLQDQANLIHATLEAKEVTP